MIVHHLSEDSSIKVTADILYRTWEARRTVKTSCPVKEQEALLKLCAPLLYLFKHTFIRQSVKEDADKAQSPVRGCANNALRWLCALMFKELLNLAWRTLAINRKLF